MVTEEQEAPEFLVLLLAMTEKWTLIEQSLAQNPQAGG